MSKINFEKIIPDSNWIIDEISPTIRQASIDVIFPLDLKDQQAISKMISYVDSCYEGTNDEYGIKAGMAIAAIQVGHNKKIIYMNFDYNGNQINYLLANPKIISYSMTKAFIECGEGCLSDIKDHPGHVLRYNKVVVEAIDLLQNDVQTKKILFEALPAICVQHEIDHLNGILYFDHIDQKQPFINDKKDYIQY